MGLYLNSLFPAFPKFEFCWPQCSGRVQDITGNSALTKFFVSEFRFVKTRLSYEDLQKGLNKTKYLGGMLEEMQYGQVQDIAHW